MARHEEQPDPWPRAPTDEQWAAMSEEERARVVAALPGEVTEAEMSPPEGDRHFLGKVRPLDALKGYFARQNRRVYLSAELPVYYPGARRFAPDLLAVLDVDPHEREKWVVQAEGKGLDFVLEVHVGGDRKKDAEFNVHRYASLGISEYFIYDRGRQRLFGYRLPSADARVYTPILPQRGSYSAQTLGLELRIEDERLRFYAGHALLLESDELITRLERMVDSLEKRADEEQRRADQEAARAQEQATRAQQEAARAQQEATRAQQEATRAQQEATRAQQEGARADRAEQRLAELQSELERLRGTKH